MREITKTARSLDPGDSIVGIDSRPSINLYRGEVASVESAPSSGIRINYRRGGYVDVASDELVTVLRKDK